MSTWISVARYQLTDRNMFVVSPWGILTLDFLLSLIIFANIPHHHGQALYAGALSAIYVVLIVSGALNISRQLPFALAIGGLTGLLAALTVALLVGGYATVRRLAV